MSLVQWLYTDPDAASGFIKSYWKRLVAFNPKVSTRGATVLFIQANLQWDSTCLLNLFRKHTHAASAILSDTTTTPGEATFITDAIKAFNKARDNEIAPPQTDENFNNAPIPNAIDPVAPVQNHIMFQVMQTNIVRPRRSSVRNNTR
ncbi:hypothetical protein HJC23_009555 [Cyclotella cryptica]|uniref:Uncharacterized protein n=1 Tax=Cyclotella cryptica TaxID=29204 RepID=A0ABD3PHX4_9STRA